MTRLGEDFNQNCFSFFENEKSCSACAAGFYFDSLSGTCVACSNNCFFCEPEQDFNPFKQFLLEQHQPSIESFANQIYISDWFKEAPPAGPEETQQQTTEQTPTEETPPDSGENTVLAKIITGHDVPKEKDLEQIREWVVDAIFDFEEVGGRTCPVCLKGFTQLESKTCIDTEIYSFSLGLSLF